MESIIKTLVFLFIPIVVLSCSNDILYGSGDLKSERRDVPIFSKIKSEGVFEVFIDQGTTQSLEIIADDNIIHKVKSKVVNNELILTLDNDTYRNINLQAHITVNTLSSIKNFGAGNITILGFSEIERLNVLNSGSANIVLEGSGDYMNLTNEGSGNIMGFDFIINNGDFDIEGSGNIEINCSNSLDITIEGSGNVYYKGQPTINSNINGSGSVINSN
ncbi:head GIN domain-containing protein [Seonamhaeicola aphaedonensis]|uniref:Putative autotransporter adhesin-like protein n=1 Tax=Seonamhaeicola aphaedonensis TaxID=1461338 RepID=A0A3D9HIZ7_9FLAO|nr:head GIN domain-containing protein [Seonamhaeicola aphaedonensis]RED49460.1 putative autotransporter adhesin-like protein [Seonamhaeicola aphaedonensis]